MKYDAILVLCNTIHELHEEVKYEMRNCEKSSIEMIYLSSIEMCLRFAYKHVSNYTDFVYEESMKNLNESNFEGIYFLPDENGQIKEVSQEEYNNAVKYDLEEYNSEEYNSEEYNSDEL